jgi:hypothetical protein
MFTPGFLKIYRLSWNTWEHTWRCCTVPHTPNLKARYTNRRYNREEKNHKVHHHTGLMRNTKWLHTTFNYTLQVQETEHHNLCEQAIYMPNYRRSMVQHPAQATSLPPFEAYMPLLGPIQPIPWAPGTFLAKGKLAVMRLAIHFP